MDEREMFEQSFKRPRDYFQRTPQEQWDIDKSLGILDWEGRGLSQEDIERFNNHYTQPIQPRSILPRRRLQVDHDSERE